MIAQLPTKTLIGHKLVFSLTLAVFGTAMLDVLSSLFLIEIAKTFLGNSSLPSVAIVSQIVTISSVMAVVFGLLNGGLSVKISHKRLLLFGALCIVVGATGCFFAPSLFFMGIFYPLDGIGTVVVASMAFTLIGESIPQDQRAKSIGIVAAGGIFSSAIGFLVAGYIASVGDWRSYLLWYVMPISLLAVGLSYALVPSPFRSSVPSTEKNCINDCFKEVFKNKSAASCLLGYMLMGTAAMWSFFAATFWIKQYSLPIQDVGTITMVTVVIHGAGSIAGGRIVDFLGRKKTVIASWSLRGILVAAIPLMPNFWLALTVTCIFMFVGGASVSSAHCLSLEQVSKSRGTMMSLGLVFGYLGASIGASLGGFLLGTYGFQLLGITFGILNVVAALTIFAFAKERFEILNN